MKKGNPLYDYPTATIPPPKKTDIVHRHSRIEPGTAHTATNFEINLETLEGTDAYLRKPQVRSDARELHEDIILNEFPEDPIPMPSAELLNLLYEFSAVKAKDSPGTQYALHPSALLALGISANELLKKQLTPLVLEHVNRVLDEEEKAGVEDPEHYNDADTLYATVFDDALEAYGDEDIDTAKEGEAVPAENPKG